MKYSFKLLQQFVPQLTEMKPEALFDVLSTRLSEVEQIEDLSNDYRELLVAKVLDVKKHPNSNKLYVVKLDIGTRIVTVVAGAGNMQPGDYVPYTPVGVRVPRNAYPERFDGIVRKIKLAGIESEGMLNSEYELNISDDHSQILILKQDELPLGAESLKAGMSLAAALGFDDYLIEIENKSMTHRGDVFSHLGLANEIGAIIDAKVNVNLIPLFNADLNNVKEFTQKGVGYKKELELLMKQDRVVLGKVSKGALRYKLVLIDLGQKIGALSISPLWLKVFLSKFNINPVNIIVDLTNYFALVYGQPMHAFDYDKVINLTKDDRNEISVDYVSNGKLEALDNKSYEIKDKTLSILLNGKPIAFAGVIGGRSTAIDSDTSKILLEVATFSYSDIRRTSMLYGLNTMASIIYSRQQDPNKVSYISDTYVYLLNNVVPQLGYVPVGDVINVANNRRTIKINTNYIRRITSLPKLTDKVIINVLERLRFKVKQVNDNTLEVIPPSDRLDINIKEDIIEEVIRIIGYEKVKVSLPKSVPTTVSDDSKVIFKDELTSIMVSKGYIERVGLGFVSQKLVSKLNIVEDSLYHIINAISPEVNYYRPFLSIQALQSIPVGLAYTDLYSTFEIGHTAMKLQGTENQEGKALFFDIPSIRHELPYPNEYIHFNVMVASRQYGVLQLLSKLKADTNWLFAEYGLRVMPIMQGDNKTAGDTAENILPAYDKFEGYSKWGILSNILNKYNSGFIIYNDHIIGVLGALNARTKNLLGLPGDIAFIELELDKLITAKSYYNVHSSSKHTPVLQDFTFVIQKHIPFYAFETTFFNVINSLYNQNKNLHLMSEYVDIFEGADYYSVTVRIRFVFYDNFNDDVVYSIRSQLIEKMLKKGYPLKGADM